MISAVFDLLYFGSPGTLLWPGELTLKMPKVKIVEFAYKEYPDEMAHDWMKFSL